ncbi:hypothetical protein J6590_082719 [Homalodisca vitripennis]|nr:hypothetical protein J6590_082719 [Homalodisca vitripennis]
MWRGLNICNRAVTSEAGSDVWFDQRQVNNRLTWQTIGLSDPDGLSAMTRKLLTWCYDCLQIELLEGLNPSDVTAQKPKARTRHTRNNEGGVITRNSMSAFPVISRRVISNKEHVEDGRDKEG